MQNFSSGFSSTKRSSVIAISFNYFLFEELFFDNFNCYVSFLNFLNFIKIWNFRCIYDCHLLNKNVKEGRRLFPFFLILVLFILFDCLQFWFCLLNLNYFSTRGQIQKSFFVFKSILAFITLNSYNS